MKYWVLLLLIIGVAIIAVVLNQRTTTLVRDEVAKELAESTKVAVAQVRGEMQAELDAKLDTIWNHIFMGAYHLPDSIWFCQRVPLERAVVREKIEREMFRFLRQRASLVWWYRLYGRYDSLFLAILRERGLPEELAIWPVLEALVNPRAHSSAGAEGLWQFMPETGSSYGLQQTKWHDQRRDIVRSTQAASRHLADLYKLSQLHREYGDWWLAFAQYVCSPGAVNAAVKKQGHRDYWTLKISRTGDAERYVAQHIALYVIFTHPHAFGLDLVSQYEPLPPLVDTLIYLPHGGTVADLAHAAGVSLDDFYTLSTAYLGEPLPANTKFHVWKTALRAQ